MLKEVEELLVNLSNENKIKQIKTNIRKNKLISIKKILIKVLIILMFLLIFIFPVQMGTIIGTWINDFFITIYKNIKI